MAATAVTLIKVEVTGMVVLWKKEVGGGVEATTQPRAKTTTDNTHNNQKERSTGWMKMEAAMATMMGLANVRVQWGWTLWVGWP